MGEIIDFESRKRIKQEKEAKKEGGYIPTVYDQIDEKTRANFMSMASKHFSRIENGTTVIDDDKVVEEEQQLRKVPDEEVIAFLKDPKKVDSLIDDPHKTIAYYNRLSD